jgi:elongation factor Tu
MELLFSLEKPHCNIGTIGHVDHGKTTLTAAITKTLSDVGLAQYVPYDQIDKIPEERERGITIMAAHVEYETFKRHYAHIDCPGHQHYIKNMITGAVQLDGVILVVSVKDGPQEQTREHLILIRELGIKYIIVYMNKYDSLVELDLRDLAELEVSDMLDSYNFDSDGITFVYGSARNALRENNLNSTLMGRGSIFKLLRTIDKDIYQPRREIDQIFIMPIETIFMKSGRGTIVTGSIEQGVVKANEEVDLVGYSKENKKVVCVEIEMFRSLRSKAEAGQNVGILLKGVKREDVVKGHLLCKKNTVYSYSKFKAKIYILSKEEGGRKHPFKKEYKPQFYIRTADLTGSFEFDDELKIVMPGDTINVVVNLLVRIGLAPGVRFTLREGRLTIGAGIVLDVLN